MGRWYKINSIIIANVDGSANADFDLILNNAGSNTFLVKTVVVPADATLVAFDKNSSFYLLGSHIYTWYTYESI